MIFLCQQGATIQGSSLVLLVIFCLAFVVVMFATEGRF